MPSRTMPAANAAALNNSMALLSGLEGMLADPADLARSQDERLRWCKPGELFDLAKAMAAQDDHLQVYWLYRAPWASLGDAGDPAVLQERLERWSLVNRDVLNRRRQLGGRLRLVNLDSQAAGLLWQQLGTSTSPQLAPAASASTPVIAKLFEWGAPRYWEVFEALEAASWLPSGEPTFRSAIAAMAANEFHDALARLAQGAAAPALRSLLSESELLRVDLDKSLDDALTQLSELREQSVRAGNRIAQQAADNEQIGQESEVHLLNLQKTREELETSHRRMQAFELALNRERDAQKQAASQHSQLQQQLDQATQVIAQERALRAAAEQAMQALRDESASVMQSLLQERRDHSELQLASDNSRRQLARLQAKELERTQHEASRKSVGVRAASAMRTRIRNVGRPPPATDPSDEQLANILDSGWFDADWYLDTYPDVRAAQLDPAIHYLHHGWKEGRNPSPSFNTTYYLDAYPDVAQSGLNPLWHFVMFGQEEGRRPREG